MEIQRKKEALKEDDRRRRNLARQVAATQMCLKTICWSVYNNCCLPAFFDNDV